MGLCLLHYSLFLPFCSFPIALGRHAKNNKLNVEPRSYSVGTMKSFHWEKFKDFWKMIPQCTLLSDEEHYIKFNSILSFLKFSKNDELKDVAIKWLGWKCGLHHPLSNSSSREGDIRTWLCKFHCEMLPRPPQLFQRVMDLISSIWHPDGQEGLYNGKWELFYSLLPGVQGKWWNPKVYDVLASWENFSKTHQPLFINDTVV